MIYYSSTSTWGVYNQEVLLTLLTLQADVRLCAGHGEAAA